VNAAVKAVLMGNLKTLKLASMLKHFEEVVRQANESKSSYEECLLNLTEIEVNVRKENGRQRRVREANFPLLKPLETFNFSAAPDLDARFVKELASCGFIKEKRNVIFLGKSGTGKTHLATALGVEACSHGHRTRFVTGCSLANELIEARNEKILSRAIKRYASCNPLIIDELGYVPFSKEGAELLFQVLADRHEMRSVIITTNMGFGDWTQIFGDPNLTAAFWIASPIKPTSSIVVGIVTD
jgi:DNA replication protein DnaC